MTIFDVLQTTDFKSNLISQHPKFPNKEINIQIIHGDCFFRSIQSTENQTNKNLESF
jgi:hypothetical protein